MSVSNVLGALGLAFVVVAGATLATSMVQPVEAKPEYKVIFTKDVWHRVDINTGDTCLTDVEMGRWLCSEEFNEQLDTIQLQQDLEDMLDELEGTPEWSTDPSIDRRGA